MVSGKVLYTDSPHLKANANKNRYTKQEIEKSVKEYFADLDKDIEQDRVDHGKEPLKKRANS